MVLMTIKSSSGFVKTEVMHFRWNFMETLFMQTIKNQLREFKLSGIYQSLEERLIYAKEKSLSYSDFLSLLLEDEANNRKDNRYKKSYSKAKLPAYKNIEDFDFSFQP